MKKLLLFSLFALLASAMGWAATETWKKVTSTPDSWDGKYLIVYEAGSVAFDGSLPKLDAANNTTPVTISSDGTIRTITTNDCNFYFTIANKGTIKSQSGLYIGRTSNDNGLDAKTTELTNTLSIENGNFVVKSSGGAYLRYNSNSDQKRFRYYSSGQKSIALYKKQEGQAPQPTPSQVAALEIKPGFGTIEVGTEITISCATGGAVLNGTIGTATGTETLEGAALPYTFTASEVGEIEVGVWATKNGYKDSEVLENKFIVKAAVPVAYRDVITAADFVAKKQDYSYNFNINKSAVYNVHTYAQNDYFQFNKENRKNNGIVMTSSPASPSKIIINWHANKNSVTIYGKNIPYNNIGDLYGNDKGTEIATVKAGEVGTSTTIDLNNQYTYIGILAPKSVEINFIEFIWGEGAAGNADVTYTKASEAKAGNFAVLATADGKAVGRNADLNPAGVTVSGDAIGLDKSQADVDEFEIVEKDATNKIYQLCGGLSSDGSRRFLTYDAAGGVTTVAATVTKVNNKEVLSTEDVNADVTFVSTEAGLLVKFNDGKYLMFNGAKFIKADNGETLTPVIVFMSSSNVSTGVETVEFDENAEAQYFNLNGVQVKAENLTPGLYIVRQGNKVSKQVIR